MTREEKVRVVAYLRRLEWITEQDACRWRGKVEKYCKGYEDIRDEICALAASLQAEIDEMEIIQPEQEG